jgi:ATP-dependent Clp protease ATP-binding subunit ClpA
MHRAWLPDDKRLGFHMPLSRDVRLIYSAAYSIAHNYRYEIIDVDHLWLGIVMSKSNAAAITLSVCNIEYDSLFSVVNPQVSNGPFTSVCYLSPNASIVFNNAERESIKMGHMEVDAVDLLNALVSRNDKVSKMVFSRMVDFENLRIDRITSKMSNRAQNPS